jgi:hypothetical protein
MADYLNPALKGIHLKLTKKFEATKEEMEDKLKSWKEDSMEVTILMMTILMTQQNLSKLLSSPHHSS